MQGEVFLERICDCAKCSINEAMETGGIHLLAYGTKDRPHRMNDLRLRQLGKGERSVPTCSGFVRRAPAHVSFSIGVVSRIDSSSVVV